LDLCRKKFMLEPIEKLGSAMKRRAFIGLGPDMHVAEIDQPRSRSVPGRGGG
jgi:hypothetical protein